MKKKIKLNSLKVQSFQTSQDKAITQTLKGGASANFDCPRASIDVYCVSNVMNTNAALCNNITVINISIWINPVGG